MSELLDFAGLYRLLADLVGKGRTCTLLGRSDDNHALMIGLRGGQICLFVYAGKQGMPAVAAARGISTLTVRRDDIGIPVGRTDMPPTAQIMQALAQPKPAQAIPPVTRAPEPRSPPSPPRAAPPPAPPAAPPTTAHFVDTVRAVALAELATQSLRQEPRSSPPAAARPVAATRLAAQPPGPRRPAAATRPPAQPSDAARPVAPNPSAPAAAHSAVRHASPAPEFEDSQWARLFERPEPAAPTAGFFTDLGTGEAVRGEASAQDSTAGPDAVDVRVAEHNHRAWQLFRKGEYEAALAELDAAKALAPDHPTLLANIKRIERRAHAQPEPEHNPWAMP